jgi:hypothetical protein
MSSKVVLLARYVHSRSDVNSARMSESSIIRFCPSHQRSVQLCPPGKISSSGSDIRSVSFLTYRGALHSERVRIRSLHLFGGKILDGDKLARSYVEDPVAAVREAAVSAVSIG